MPMLVAQGLGDALVTCGLVLAGVAVLLLVLAWLEPSHPETDEPERPSRS